jgi:dGTPase
VSALAAYAAREENSRGRRHAEAAPPYRSEYQRDRDRIVHSTAFRRLVYKTQVFVNHEGDLYRTRLTHSLEVAQIARTIARALNLNEVLSEAICLAHDLGHTPFGHAGQDALNACMREFGGFEHNLQSLRVVDVLEEHYAEFDGLNLTFECREGILKHCSHANALQLGDVGSSRTSRTKSRTTITMWTMGYARDSSASRGCWPFRCSRNIMPKSSGTTRDSRGASSSMRSCGG